MCRQVLTGGPSGEAAGMGLKAFVHILLVHLCVNLIFYNENGFLYYFNFFKIKLFIKNKQGFMATGSCENIRTH